MNPSRFARAFALVLAACGPASTTQSPAGAVGADAAGADAVVADTSATHEGAARADASATPSAAPDAKNAPPERMPQTVEGGPPAADVNRLSEGDEKALGACKTFTDAVNKKARAHAKALGSTEAALKVIDEVDGDDDCRSLLRRGLVDAIATRREGEVIVSLKKMAFGMSESFAATKKLCPSSEAVPKSTDVLRGKAYEATRTDYATPAWKCVRFDTLGTPQHFQYAIESADDGKSFRAVARGYSVDGGRIEQLFIENRVTGDALEPSGRVMRK